MNEQRLLNTFLELVRTDSESYFERPMQELVVRKLQDLGARVYVDNAGEKYETNAQGNVMACFPGTAPSEPILLVAHLPAHQCPGQASAKVCVQRHWAPAYWHRAANRQRVGCVGSSANFEFIKRN